MFDSFSFVCVYAPFFIGVLVGFALGKLNQMRT
jgi:hypothetical protein